jgi:hypothetical protein
MQPFDLDPQQGPLSAKTPESQLRQSPANRSRVAAQQVRHSNLGEAQRRVAMFDAKAGLHPQQRSDRFFGFSLAEGIGVLLLLWATSLASRYNYLLFHSIAELASIFVVITFGANAVS